MPNIANVLKSEIARIARKEVRSELDQLKKTSASYRSAIAALKRQVRDLVKRLASSQRATAKQSAKAAPVDDSGPKRRFSAARLKAHRAKLGLSAADYGKLVGVSGLSVYKWEKGEVRPRATQISALAAVKALGKREAERRLAGD